MKVASGKVVGGKVVVEGAPLTEGASVTVLVQESDETFTVTDAEEAALVQALAEVERNELVGAEQLMKDLRSHST